MIAARSPLRITLGGGGTDLPSYSDAHEGFAIAAAIDASVRVEVSPGRATDHGPIARAAFEMMELDGGGIGVSSLSDVPAGTGLGASGSFTTALLAALHRLKGRDVAPVQLAREASEIEIERLGLPVGRQDQHIAALGGILAMRFRRDGAVEAAPLAISAECRARLEAELLLFSTGVTRPASSILADQDRRTRDLDRVMLDNLHAIKELAFRSEAALLGGDVARFGRLMDEHWRVKRVRSAGMSNARIDAWYALARDNGASGGKLVGAGAGGFLMFHATDPARLRQAMRGAGLTELRFRFTAEGTRVLE